MAADLTPAYLNPKQAAVYLGLSTSQLAKWRVYGGGPAYSKASRSVRYTRDELDAWMAARVRRSTSDKGAAQ